MTKHINSYYEFFAGGGMARAGLGDGWQCLFSNDFDHKKSKTYINNWGGEVFCTADVSALTTNELPGNPDLVWASFPCQDLSLAGSGAGLRGERSGTFWPFWDLVLGLQRENRTPKVIVLENVCGTLTSHNGKDFSAICSTLEQAGYRYGAVIVDAALFLPQSRPRLFVIATHNDIDLPDELTDDLPRLQWRTRALVGAYERLSSRLKESWIWWSLSSPQALNISLSELIEENPDSVKWHSADQTKQLLAMMNDVNLHKVQEAKRANKRIVGTVYKRTRYNETGKKVQRAEVRFDNIAGCLRTPAGGSSRQLILAVEGEKVRSRLISSRETARLMGLPDSYQLPVNYNEAYHLTGDGVVVPVVRHLAEHLLEPILLSSTKDAQIAA